jgi:hypothetical protein
MIDTSNKEIQSHTTSSWWEPARPVQFYRAGDKRVDPHDCGPRSRADSRRRSLTQFLSSRRQPGWASFSRSCQLNPNGSCFTNGET